MMYVLRIHNTSMCPYVQQSCAREANKSKPSSRGALYFQKFKNILQISKRSGKNFECSQ
jgi:hypothetical protein